MGGPDPSDRFLTKTNAASRFAPGGAAPHNGNNL